MNKQEQKRLYKILEKYQGSCECMSDEDSDFLYQECPTAGDEFDNCHFCCVTCGWWCENGDQTQDPEIVEEVCEECHPYEEQMV